MGCHLLLAEKEQGAQEVPIDSKVEPAVGILLRWLGKFTSRLQLALGAPHPHPVLSEKPLKIKSAAAIDPELETRQRQEEGLETIASISWEPTYYVPALLCALQG